MTDTQIWRLGVDGHEHRVEADPGMRRRLRWYVDGALIAERGSTNDRVTLEAPAGRVRVRFSTLGAPRRATLADGDGGLDLVPDPGSAAARYEDRVRAHPGRYAALHTIGGVAAVVVPIVVAVLLARFALSLRLDLPLPDLPSLPRPDLPSLPLPDLPDWSLPGWVSRALDIAGYVWPVVLAFLIARTEIHRRRRQDEKRQQREEGTA